jgi:putative thymidine phosphorylase
LSDIKQSQLALEAIRKKLVGKKLNYKEIYAVMDQISHDKLGDVLTTYFAASGYSQGFTIDELYDLTKAMVETGEKITFPGIVADKHSIGGMPGTRTTLIIVPIVAAAGFRIPKSSSRAITTPGGTADDMEAICKVEFSKDEIIKIVNKVGGCIVWGGSFNIAPADDLLIQVEKPLLFESYDKILVSIMAKKIAFGSTHVVIDIPVGDSMKVKHRKDAEILAGKFEMIGKKFHIKIKCIIHPTHEPAGRGVGPILEVREALRVLQQKPFRPLDLEERALELSGVLLDLCLEDSVKSKQEYVKENFGSGKEWAKHLLKSGEAWQKMEAIIEAQKGIPIKDSESLRPGKFSGIIKAKRYGKIVTIDSKAVTVICRILGAPTDKKAGMYFEKKIGERVAKDEPMCIMYSSSEHNLKEAKETLKHVEIYKVR